MSQPDNTSHDKVYGDDIAQKVWPDEDQDSSNQGDYRLYGIYNNGHIASLLSHLGESLSYDEESWSLAGAVGTRPPPLVERWKTKIELA